MNNLRNRKNILLYLLEPLPFIDIGTSLLSWPKDNISCLLSFQFEFNLRAKSSTSLHRKDTTHYADVMKMITRLTSATTTRPIGIGHPGMLKMMEHKQKGTGERERVFPGSIDE